MAVSAVGTVYTIQQLSNGRYADAHEVAGEDFRMVTRTAQNNDSQRWVAIPLGNNVYTFQQLSTGRFADAHEFAGQDFRMVTRPRQSNTTQQWRAIPLGNGNYNLQQVSSSRFADAHEIAGEDFRMVTRPLQTNNTQRWTLRESGAVYTVQQVSSGRYADAHEFAGQDFRMVTRPSQNNDTQRWVATLVGNSTYTLQQLSSLRFADAHDRRRRLPPRDETPSEQQHAALDNPSGLRSGQGGHSPALMRQRAPGFMESLGARFVLRAWCHRHTLAPAGGCPRARVFPHSRGAKPALWAAAR